jgi:hypothetical protein
MEEGQSAKKTQESPAFEYCVQRLAHGFGYRAAQDTQKFREFWGGEDAKNALNLFLKDENIEQLIVQSPNSGAC